MVTIYYISLCVRLTCNFLISAMTHGNNFLLGEGQHGTVTRIFKGDVFVI